MTRKDFILIAAAIAEIRRVTDMQCSAPAALNCLSREFADRLRATNERFDRERFLRACGVEA